MTDGIEAIRVDQLQINGRVDRPVVNAYWQVPQSIRVDGDQLLWSYAEGAPWVEPSDDVFDRFAALGVDVPKRSIEERILEFARQWGVLCLCKEHGLPSSHAPGPASVETALLNCCQLSMAAPGLYSESIEAWQRYARECLAIVTLANDLHAGKPGDPREWAILERFTFAEVACGDVPAGEVLQLSPESNGTLILCTAVNCWITTARVESRLLWGHKGAFVAFNGESLFKYLALQLLLVVSRTTGLARCSGCGDVFTPSARARSGSARYCNACRADGVPLRDAKRREREAKRKSKS